MCSQQTATQNSQSSQPFTQCSQPLSQFRGSKMSNKLRGYAFITLGMRGVELNYLFFLTAKGLVFIYIIFKHFWNLVGRCLENRHISICQLFFVWRTFPHPLLPQWKNNNLTHFEAKPDIPDLHHLLSKSSSRPGEQPVDLGEVTQAS